MDDRGRINAETNSDAGWSALVAHQAHDPKVAGSNRARTTNLRMAGSGVKCDDRRGA